MKMIRISPKVLCLLGLLSLDALAAPQIQHWTLANGARVYFVETHQLPMVQFAVGFDAGSARDPATRKGVARFVSSMIDEGTDGLDSIEIAERFESVGAEFSRGSGREMSVFELRSLTDEPLLSTAVDVFAKIIQQPAFPPDAIARVRDRILTGLQRQQQSPGRIVSRTFYENLFKDHPYGNPPAGDAEDVALIVRADLVDFHRRLFVGANSVIVIVGDLSSTQAGVWADAIVGGLPSGTAPPRLTAAPTQSRQAQVLKVPFPSTQTHLMMGQIGMKRSDPDYFPLYIGNYILGGSGLISRLSDELREKRGLTYSAYSYFIPMRQNGPFIINLQTRNEQGVKAEHLALQTVTEFVQTGPTGEELEAAKQNITGGFPLRFDSNTKIAGSVLNIAFYGLPLDYMSTFTAKVSAVTTEQVKDAFQRRVFPDRLLRVAVGGG